MKQNTLLDFLTRRTDGRTTRQFQKVLADAKNEFNKDEFQHLFRNLFKSRDPKAVEKFYSDESHELKDLMPKSDAYRLGQWFNQLGPNIKKLIRGKDPLEMTPSDLENLFRVYRDPNDKLITLKIQITPASLLGDVNVDQLASMVAKFYNDNKAFFDGADKLTYDKDKMLLKYEGSNLKLKELLDALKVKPELKENILKQKEELSGLWHLPFTAAMDNPNKLYLGDWEQDERYKNDDETPNIEKFKQAVMTENDKLIQEGWVNHKAKWVEDKGQQVLQFEGSLTDIQTLFRPVLDDPGGRMIRTIKENASDFKRVGV